MKRNGFRAIVIAVASQMVLAMSGSAGAQEPTPPGQEPASPASEPAPPGQEAPATEPTLPTLPGEEPASAPGKGTGQVGSISWRDIITVPRRPILKYHRVELIPTYNVTINSPVIRHHGFGGVANFFLSETLNIALEATYYAKQPLEHLFLRGLNDRIVPAVNLYLWSAALNFGYVPLYGKFTLFNRLIFQWEAYVQAGIGVIQTEWIPRDPANLSATNFNVLWHIDLGTRLFLTKWLALQVYIKDYMMVDKFEPTARTSPAVPPESQFRQEFVNNLVFGVGIGMFLPTGFEYKYTR